MQVVSDDVEEIQAKVCCIDNSNNWIQFLFLRSNVKLILSRAYIKGKNGSPLPQEFTESEVCTITIGGWLIRRFRL